MEVPIVRVLGCTPTHALVEVVQVIVFVKLKVQIQQNMNSGWQWEKPPTHNSVYVLNVKIKVQCGQLGQHGQLVAATVRDLGSEHVMEEYVKASMRNQIPALEEVAQVTLEIQIK